MTLERLFHIMVMIVLLVICTEIKNEQTKI